MLSGWWAWAWACYMLHHFILSLETLQYSTHSLQYLYANSSINAPNANTVYVNHAIRHLRNKLWLILWLSLCEWWKKNMNNIYCYLLKILNVCTIAARRHTILAQSHNSARDRIAIGTTKATWNKFTIFQWAALVIVRISYTVVCDVYVYCSAIIITTIIISCYCSQWYHSHLR